MTYRDYIYPVMGNQAYRLVFHGKTQEEANQKCRDYEHCKEGNNQFFERHPNDIGGFNALCRKGVCVYYENWVLEGATKEDDKYITKHFQ